MAAKRKVTSNSESVPKPTGRNKPRPHNIPEPEYVPFLEDLFTAIQRGKVFVAYCASGLNAGNHYKFKDRAHFDAWVNKPGRKAVWTNINPTHLPNKKTPAGHGDVSLALGSSEHSLAHINNTLRQLFKLGIGVDLKKQK